MINEDFIIISWCYFTKFLLLLLSYSVRSVQILLNTVTKCQPGIFSNSWFWKFSLWVVLQVFFNNLRNLFSDASLRYIIMLLLTKIILCTNIVNKLNLIKLLRMKFTFYSLTYIYKHSRYIKLYIFDLYSQTF